MPKSEQVDEYLTVSALRGLGIAEYRLFKAAALGKIRMRVEPGHPPLMHAADAAAYAKAHPGKAPKPKPKSEPKAKQAAG